MYADQFKRQERPEDRTHEVDTITAFCKHTDWIFVKEEGEQDFRLYRWNEDKPIRATFASPMPCKSGGTYEYAAVAEAKWRNSPADKFQTYTIDQHKLHALQERGRNDGVLALLMVSWPGSEKRDRRYLNVTRLDLSKLQTTIIRRRDRDEEPDPGYHIPMELFHKF